MKFLSVFKRKKLNEVVNDEIMAAEIVPPVSQGRMVKTKHQQFSIDADFNGGRMVKTMPKSLRHMKELSEKTDD